MELNVEFRPSVNGAFPQRCKPSYMDRGMRILDGAKKIRIQEKLDGWNGTITLDKEGIHLKTINGQKDEKLESLIPRDAFVERAYKIKTVFSCEICAMVWEEGRWHCLGHSAVPTMRDYLYKCERQGISEDDIGLKIMFHIFRIEEFDKKNCGLIDDEKLEREWLIGQLLNSGQTSVVQVKNIFFDINQGYLIQKLDGRQCSLRELPARLIEKAQEVKVEGYIVSVDESSSIFSHVRSDEVVNGYPRLNNSFKVKKTFDNMTAAVFKYIGAFDEAPSYVLCLRAGHTTLKICGRISLRMCGGTAKRMLEEMPLGKGRCERTLWLDYQRNSGLAVKVSCAWMSKNSLMSGIKPIMEVLPAALDEITYLHTVTEGDPYWAEIQRLNELARTIMEDNPV